jgi:hypothetical protein
MAAVPKKLKFVLFGFGPKINAIAATVLEFLGLGCLVVGIIGSVQQKMLWMDPYGWFYTTIALWIWAIWLWFCAYTAAKD